MNKPVIVTAKDGKVVQLSPKNNKYGYIRVIQDRLVTDAGGFARIKHFSALIPGEVNVLEQYGWTEGQEIQGKIVAIETLSPINPKDPEQGIKEAGDTGIPCTSGGSPIYRKQQFTFDLNAQDVLIAHDNVEAIKAAREEASEETEEVSGDPQEDFKV